MHSAWWDNSVVPSLKISYLHTSVYGVQGLPDFGLNMVKFEGNQIERGCQLEFYVHIYVLK